jgi:hypothetical protein
MSKTHDAELDMRLREALGSGPKSRPIPNLPERAISLAISRQLVSGSTPVWHKRSHRTRFISLASVLAIVAIASVWLIGIWSVVANNGSFSALSPGVSASASEQTGDLGFAIAILAAIALIVGLVTQSFLDSTDDFPSGAEVAPLFR